jgi:Raf kinase inhibitor-like YbhB/YbcL family protein
MDFRLSSSAFSEGETIPRKHTCDGQNISPPLEWTGQPASTQSLAIICDDPDAPSGTFTHWVLYDLANSTQGLEEGSSGGGKEGQNSFKRSGFGGPCPPPNGGTHRYFFYLYALDISSLGPAGLSKQDVTTAMQGHILGEAELMGTYEREKT